jgi:hydrogenase nickel incorporation protein HypB
MNQLEVKKRILASNEEAADELRHLFSTQGTLVVNLISSPGSGKTAILEKSVHVMGKDFKLGALVGDIATEKDAERLKRAGLNSQQIITGGACHLDARLVRRALDTKGFQDLDILFIENVGNLVCPTSFDLGEDFKVVLLSVTEGDDKPFKYPGIFSKASFTLITKVDLLRHVDFDLMAVRNQVASLNPDGGILLTSAWRGDGIQTWCHLITELFKSKKRYRITSVIPRFEEVATRVEFNS